MVIKKLIISLRNYGWLGGFCANVLQFLLWAYPALTFAAVLTAIASMYVGVIQWAQSPTVYTLAGMFLFLLWTSIGLSVIRRSKEPTTVRISHDYAYSLIAESMSGLIAKFPASDPYFPNGDAFQLQLIFRNVGAGPLRLRVEEVRVVLDGRTSNHPDKELDLIFSRVGAKGIRCAPLSIDLSKGQYSGTAAFKLLYGPPDSDFVRRYSYRVNINVSLSPDQTQFSLLDEILDERDEPYSKMS